MPFSRTRVRMSIIRAVSRDAAVSVISRHKLLGRHAGGRQPARQPIGQRQVVQIERRNIHRDRHVHAELAQHRQASTAARSPSRSAHRSCVPVGLRQRQEIVRRNLAERRMIPADQSLQLVQRLRPRRSRSAGIPALSSSLRDGRQQTVRRTIGWRTNFSRSMHLFQLGDPDRLCQRRGNIEPEVLRHASRSPPGRAHRSRSSARCAPP